MVQTRDPVTGQLFIDGAAHVRTYGEASTVSKRMLTINGADDVFTAKANPAEAELLGATYDGTKKHLRVTYNTSQSEIPFASVVVVTVNAGSAGQAVTDLTFSDTGGGDTTSTDEGMRMVSDGAPVIEYDFTGTSSFVDDVYCGGYSPAGTPAGAVYIMLEVW